MSRIAAEALRPNPALKPLEALVGTWKSEGAHPLMPGVALHGRTSFDWIEGGAFLRMYSEIDEPGIPSAVAVFGSDDERKECYMVYFDERGVSRKYHVSISGKTLSLWRGSPSFSQRFTYTLSKDGSRMSAKGEMQRGGAPWEADLALEYTRLK